MNPVIAAARRVAHFAWYRHARPALERTDACSLFGLDLVIEPGVLHPRHFASSRFLGEYLTGLRPENQEVADLGTGSGLLALLAARAGAAVTAIDIDPIAVACATGNARRNGLGDRVRVIASDVFDHTPAEARFDLVVTNPPFYPRDARTPSDRAFAAGAGNGFFAKLADGLPRRLKSGGSLAIIQSSDTDFAPIARLFEARGLKGRIVRERRSLFETLTIREFTHG